jgi:hypothetical protein
MPLFSEMPLFCCICGVTFHAGVNRQWHGFDEAVCGAGCYYEKEWRKTLSTLGKAYYPDPRQFRRPRVSCERVVLMSTDAPLTLREEVRALRGRRPASGA